MQVIIRYGAGAVDRFIEIADVVEERFPDLMVDGEEADDLGQGSFEVTTEDGRVLISAAGDKLQAETVIEALEAANIS